MTRHVLCGLSILALVVGFAWSQEEKPKNKKEERAKAKAEAKAKGEAKAEKKAAPAKVELEYPPKLPGGEAIVTDTSPDFLKPLKELPEGVTVAKTPPTIDFGYFPEQTYAGRPWSNWGESVVANGKYYCAFGDHLAPQGNAFVMEYDPATKKIRTLMDLKKLLKMPEGHYAPGKIHSRLGVGKDGWLYCTTHRGSTTITTDQYHYKGDWIVRVHPETGVTEVVQAAPVPKHCLPCAHLDPDRLILYGGSAVGSNEDKSGIQFWAYDLANRKMIYSGPNGPSRAMMVSKSTGKVYFVPGTGDSPLMRFDPATGKAPEMIPGELSVRAATDETPSGKIFVAGQRSGGCDLFEFDVKTEKIRNLGPAAVGSEQYVACLSAEATGKYIYYSPGAHGGGYRDGTPVVQWNTQTGKRKVIAFLHPFYEQKYGCAIHGTYAVSVTPDGSTVFCCWNAARGTKGWDTCARRRFIFRRASGSREMRISNFKFQFSNLKSQISNLSALILCLGFASTAFSADADGNRFFETKIRPILVKHCYECHGPELQEHKLRVDSLEGLTKGGKAGAFIVAGKPEKSLLITAVGYQVPDLQMPPEKKLADSEIADLTAWVKMGAPHPDRQGKVEVVEKLDIAAARKFWSFQPAVDHAPPVVKDAAWAKTALDQFVLKELEAKGLRPAKPADKLALLRRTTFDLTGLPPTPAEIEAFLKDESPTAFAAVVDRLLESPHYGERWGRHWLDVARYADSNGLDENIAHGNAWRYRDYVIRSLNADKPYDQFLVEQLAGDLLPPTDDAAVTHDRLIATGFLSLGPKVLAEVDETKMEMDILDEQVDTVGRSLLGLTFGCARCHDHKFDPIRAEDYYALAGIFKSTRTMEHFKKIARWWENPLATPAEVQRKAALDKLVAEQKAALDALVKKAKDELQAKLKAGETLPKEFEAQLAPEVQTELKVRREELAKLTASVPVIPTAMGVSEGKVTDVPVHIRGSHLALGQVVPRGFPVVLVSTEQPVGLPADKSGRLELAQWLTRKDHPLTARVLVNRVWRWHFGQGIVSTPDNFGKLGERPTHPELLDWLSLRFIEQGWSLKKLHRLIMLSQTYQMSSDFDAASAAADPENRLYWRMPLRRLEAEEIRDAILASSGLLDLTRGGSLLHVGNREFLFDHTSKDGTKYDSRKRSIYLPVIRNNLYDVFQLFDATDATVLDGNRATTVVAPQALFMLNSDLVLAASKNLAESVIAETASAPRRIEQLYLRTYGRSATSADVTRAAAYVEKQRTSGKSEVEAWASLSHVILSANEFIYLR